MRLGAHNLGESDHEDVDDYVPEQVILHPEYNDSTSLPTHDIAIIVLQTEGREESGLILLLPSSVGDIAVPSLTVIFQRQE